MRHLIALAALALAAASCAKVIGVSEDRARVSALMCNCESEISFFSSGKECEDYIDERLASASDEVLGAWLDAYESRCSSCGNVLECFQMPPVCKTRGCTEDWHCCSGGKCDDTTGVCGD